MTPSFRRGFLLLLVVVISLAFLWMIQTFLVTILLAALFSGVAYGLHRQIARGLKGKHCYEVMEHNICRDNCIAMQCWQGGRHVRLDEISSTIVGDTEAAKLRFILSAIPITDEQGNHIGALEIQRNVTDEAEVQVKYQEMLESEARERERLATQIRARTRELLDRYEPVIDSLRRDGRAAVASQDLDHVEAFLTRVEASSGPGLAGTLRELRRDLRDPQARAELGIEVREPVRDGRAPH